LREERNNLVDIEKKQKNEIKSLETSKFKLEQYILRVQDALKKTHEKSKEVILQLKLEINGLRS
jgi:hypothetical protein